MRRLQYVICLLIFTRCLVSGQSSFSANRPGQVKNADITPKGNFMIETGLQYGKTEGEINYLLPTMSVRYGISSAIEISLNADNLYQYETSALGLTSNNISTKIAICEQKDLLPKITFLSSLILPVAGIEEMKPEHTGGSFGLSASHTIGSKAVLYANAGAIWTGNTNIPVYNYVLTMFFTPVSRFWIFGEFYGFVPGDGGSSIATDFGVSWQAGDNFQLDLTTGFDLSEPKNNHFIQLGAAFQIVRKSK